MPTPLVLTNFNQSPTPVEKIRGYSIGLVSSAATSTTEKKWGSRSLYLPSTLSVATIEVPYTDIRELETSDSTIEFWVYITDNTPDQYFFGWFEPGDFAGWGFEVAINQNALGCYNWWNDADFTFGVDAPANPFVENTWIHVAFVMEGEYLRVFVNGAYFDQRYFPRRWTLSKPHAEEENTVGFCIAGDDDSWALRGYMDDFRVSPTALYTGTGAYAVPTAEFDGTFVAETLEPENVTAEQGTEAIFSFSVENHPPSSPTATWTYQWIDARTNEPPPNISEDPRVLHLKGITQAQSGVYYCSYTDGISISGKSKPVRLTAVSERASADFKYLLVADDWGEYANKLELMYSLSPEQFNLNIANIRNGFDPSMLAPDYPKPDGTPSLRTYPNGITVSPFNGNVQSLEDFDYTLHITFKVESFSGVQTLWDFGAES